MSSDEIPKVEETSLISPNACWYIRPNENKSHKKNKTGPCRRWGHAADIIEGKLYIYGGTGHTTNPRHWESVYKLELEGWDWTKLESLNKSPGPRDSHSCTLFQNKMYLFGGSFGNDSKNDLFEYDLIGNSWKKLDVKGDVPSPREGHLACILEEKYIVIYGGWNVESTYDDCYLFDIATKTWIKITKKSGTEPSPRESQSGCMIKNYIYLFGGQGNSTLKEGDTVENFFNDLHRFKVVQENGEFTCLWEKVEPEGNIRPSKRSSHSSCAYKDRYMVIVGGEGYPPDFNENQNDAKYQLKNEDDDDEYPCFPKNDIWYFDTEINKWFKLKIVNEGEFVPRFAHTSNIYKDILVVFGGLRDYHHSTNDICVLSLDGSDPFVGATNFNTNGQTKMKSVVSPDDSSDSDNSETNERYDKPERIEKYEKVEIKEKIEKNEKSLLTKVNQNTSGLKSKTRFQQQAPVNTEISVEKAPVIKYEGPTVSIGFMYSLSKSITWPLAAFGLFLDNSVITKCSNFNVNFINKPKKISNEEEKNDDLKKSYLLIQDDGFGWGPKEFVHILSNYDVDGPDLSNFEIPDDHEEAEKLYKLNEYGFNLKIGGFRLGKTLIYISRSSSDDISIGLISAEKKINPNIHNNHVFFTSWNKKNPIQFITPNGEKNKSIILNALIPYIGFEELMKDIEKLGNKILIFDLNCVVSNNASNKEDLELIAKNKAGSSDILTRTLDRKIQPFYTEYNIIELSLRTYFAYFFLEQQKKPFEYLHK